MTHRLTLALTSALSLLAGSAAPKDADAVRVFVLAGQSNMEGHGKLEGKDGAADPGTLAALVADPANRERYAAVVGDDGGWAVRDDVWIWYQDGERHGALTVGCGAREELFGPELGFGLVLGEALEEPVLLIKVAWGGKSLAVDFRPPSSGGEVGPCYTALIEHVRHVLGGVGELFPELEGRTPELAGFGWHQGWNDGCDAAAVAEYEGNLANLVRDVRKDLDAPGLPFVVATSGFGGWAQEHPRRLGIVEAQLAVARAPELEGCVRAVETRGFWREAEESPSKQGYHWNHNAETHFAIGEAMGVAMLELLPAPASVVIADFEGEDYGEWKTTGEAFGAGPARGTFPNQMQVSGYLGRGVVNSYLGGDGTTGTLTSPPFTLERRYLNFLIGGGGYEGETCIDLLVEGEVVRTATGPNVRPGGSEELDWATWDVLEHLGESAVLRIVDRRTSGWGHVNVDQIELSDRRRTREPAETTRSLRIREGAPYLQLPVKNGAPKRRLELSVDGALVHELDVELAIDQPDWWAPLDVSALAGKRATVAVDALERGSCGLRGIHQTDHLRGKEELYEEWLRPQLHFSQRRGWNNDPNGLVWMGGEFHLFFQHNPVGTQWANMHWGHAVSTDLVHWEELPIALFPWVQAVGHCFSGSAVVDARNTAGFKTGGEDVLVAVFTDTGCGEALAYSNDRGRTFTYYPKNPVVEHRGRDPKVFWHEPTGHWVMAVYDEDERYGANIAIHTSPNLLEWTERSHLPGYYECPELFELSVEGDPGNTRWVVWGADARYALGAFDGEVFTPEHEGKHQLHWGGYYASQTFNGAPDGRRIQVGWARIELEGMPFNQMMGFPTELSLRTTADDGVRLFAEPVRELEALRRRGHVLGERALRDGTPESLPVAGRLFDVRATFAMGDAERFGLDVGGTRVVYDATKHELAGMPLEPEEGRIHLQLVVDRPSLEVCGNHGRVYLTRAFRPGGEVRSIEAFAEGGSATLVGLEVFELESVWR